MWLWRLRSHTICHLWARDTGKLGGIVGRPETQESWWYRFLSQVWRHETQEGQRGQDKFTVPAQAIRQREGESKLPLLLWDPQWMGWCPPALGRRGSALLTPSIRMLLSSPNIHRHTYPEITFIGAFSDPVRLLHEINHYRWIPILFSGL